MSAARVAQLASEGADTTTALDWRIAFSYVNNLHQVAQVCLIA